MAVYRVRCLMLILIQGVLCLFESVPLTPENLKTRYYELDPEKLRDLWRNAMLRGFIKARAKELLSVLPKIENVVYQQCEKDARTTVALAKCAVRVFDARDNAKRIDAEKEPKEHRLIASFSARLRPYPDLSWKTTHSYGSQMKNSEYSPIFRYSTKDKPRNPIRKQIRRGNTNLFMGNYMTSMNKETDIQQGDSKMEEILQNSVNSGRRRNKRGIDGDAGTTLSSLNLRRIVMKYLDKVLGGSSRSSHLENLRLIRDHFKRVEKVNSYFKHMNEQNRGLFEKVALPIDSRTPEITNNAMPAIERVLSIMNDFAATKTGPSKVSVLSPRVLSLFPESTRSSSKRLLSPTFFSFQKDGYLSLPELFDIITTNQRYQQLMVDVMMDISGAGDILEKVVVDLKSEMDELKNVKLPLVEELSERDEDWMRVHNSFDEEQARYYTKHGYAFLNEDQLNLIYSRDEQQIYGMNTTKLGMMTDQEKAQRLEDDIRKLAALDRPNWPMWDDAAHRVMKRHASEETTSMYSETKSTHGHHHEEERVNGVLYETLRPYAFTTILSRGAAMEAVTLSPHAFVAEVAHPEALLLQTLSPRAFIASILSPAALIARILSPTALRAEVLSPRALHTWVLSPEAMVTEVLSPRFLDPRILSPKAIVIDVLSPGILSPHVLSSEIGGVIILSPNILSPRVASEEKLLVEILSPNILGGHHEEESSGEEGKGASHSPSRNTTEEGLKKHTSTHGGGHLFNY